MYQPLGILTMIASWSFPNKRNRFDKNTPARDSSLQNWIQVESSNNWLFVVVCIRSLKKETTIENDEEKSAIARICATQ